MLSEAAIPAMVTEASKTRSLEIAFLVDDEHLRQLETVLRGIGDSLEYQVKFSDGHTLQYHDIEEVLKLPNSRARSIVSLISGVTGRGKQSAYVVLKDKFPQASSSLGDDSSPSVEYTITGTQKNVIYLGDKLDEWTAGIRQWYSAFYRGVFSFVLGTAILLGPFFVWQYASLHLFTPTFLKAHDLLPITFLAALWTGIYWTLKLFPRATFAIGQGARRHQFFVYIRRSVLAAFALSVMAKLFANWVIPH